MGIELTSDNKGRVLLADDNEINAEIASLQLKDIGLEVDWVTNGRKALEVFSQSDIAYYDIIVMDIMMPVMDGLEAAEEIRKLDRADAQSVPIIAVSANSFPENDEQLTQNGVSCFITKPYSKSKFQTMVSELIEAGDAV